MNENEYRAWRVRLRQVTGALMAEALASGAESEAVGVMEVVRNPRQPGEGYVTPRHGTVWVPDSQVRAALDELQAAGGPARVRLLDGLYPPRFITALRALGLTLTSEAPLHLLPLELADLDDRTPISARPALGTADTARWHEIIQANDPAPPGAQDWLMVWEGIVAAAARFGAVGGRAARLVRFRSIGAVHEPATTRLLLTAACASSALSVDLLFSEASAAEDRALLEALGFRATGAVLTFEEAQ